MIIYADITFFNNFLMTLAILWAIAKILDIDYSLLRLCLSALVATIYLFIVLIIQVMGLSIIPYFIIHIGLNLFSAITIIKLAFPSLNQKKTIKSVIYLYLITFIIIGTTIAIFFLLGRDPYLAEIDLVKIQLRLLALFAIFILANFAWSIFQNYKKVEDYYLSVRVYYQNESIEVIGLVDTGNSLIDPISRMSVIIVNYEEILPLFPELLEDNLLFEDDLLKIIDVFSKYNYGNRIRLIPFSDLSKEHGILIGFRPDYVEIKYNNYISKNKKCIIALSKRRLDNNNEYQALVHPNLLRDI
ncbi:MAG: sigma-E processing peptidase SpoIIGA [bacterium]